MDILKELLIDKDNVDIIQTRRLTYVGHVTRVKKNRYLHILLHGYSHGHRARSKKRWLDNIYS